MRTAINLAILVLAGTAGDLAITHAMKQNGEVRDFRASTIIAAVAGAFRRGWMWLGLSLHALAFFSFLALLSWASVSVVVPASALSYVVGALGAKLFLRERVTLARWAGALLICFGVMLVLAS